MLEILLQPNDSFNRLGNLSLAMLWRAAVSVLLLAVSVNQAASQIAATNRQSPKPVVVELSVIARDEIPSSRTENPASTTGYPGWIENNKIILHPEAARQMRWRQSGRSLFFSGKIRSFKEAKFIFIERISYAGTGRTGTFTRLFLSRVFPRFPHFNPPGKVFFGPLADRARLMRIIPWPRMEWRMLAGNILEITTGAKVKQLKQSQKFEIAERSVEIPMRLVRYKPVPAGNVYSSPQRQDVDVGKGRFAARVTIIFHGALNIEIAK